MAVPITLKAFSGIVLAFQLEKLFELRIARHDLLGYGELMIRQVITSAAGYRQIDQAAKRACRRFDACRCMKRAQIEDDARITFLGPRQESLVIFFNQSD